MYNVEGIIIRLDQIGWHVYIDGLHHDNLYTHTYVKSKTLVRRDCFTWYIVVWSKEIIIKFLSMMIERAFRIMEIVYSMVFDIMLGCLKNILF